MNGRKIFITTVIGLLGTATLLAETEQQLQPLKDGQGKKVKHFKGKKKVDKMKQRRRMLHYLNANYPSEMKEIKELGKTDPQAAREKLRALAQKGLARIKQQRQEFKNLIKKYRETKDEAVLAQIKTKVSTLYDKRLKYAEKAVDRLESKLQKARTRLADLKSKREENIEKIINRIKNGHGKKGHWNKRRHRKHNEAKEDNDIK